MWLFPAAYLSLLLHLYRKYEADFSGTRTVSKLLIHHEVLMGIGASQIISNVPAAILLSGFTDDYSALLIGVNLGGLGTLIASLASLISFKFYANSNGRDTRRFLGIFTLYNVIFLGVLFVLSLILC